MVLGQQLIQKRENHKIFLTQAQFELPVLAFYLQPEKSRSGICELTTRTL